MKKTLVKKLPVNEKEAALKKAHELIAEKEREETEVIVKEFQAYVEDLNKKGFSVLPKIHCTGAKVTHAGFEVSKIK